MNSSSVCVDASLALAWLFFDDYREPADELLKQWADDGVELIAPPMFHAEVASGLRKSVYLKRISPADGEQLFAVYSQLPVRIVSGWEIYQKAWELAKEFSLPVCYDMQYLAVAELADCQFWTLDRRLVNAVRARTKRVRWVGEYKVKGKTR